MKTIYKTQKKTPFKVHTGDMAKIIQYFHIECHMAKGPYTDLWSCNVAIILKNL